MSKRYWLSENTFNRMKQSISVTENLAPRSTRRQRVRIRSAAGGGAERPYVVITSVTSAELYTGNVLAGPEDPTVVTTGVTIKVKGAVSNELEVGYDDFSDKVGDIYYLNGYLLG